MSVTGVALILFLTFHCCMNVAALFSGEAYNWICEALGANWYAVVATLGLAALAVIHIVYAFILTAQNRRARGNERYAVTDKPEKVEWASQNMLVLGIIILLGLLLHLFNFWYNMMFAELIGMEGLTASAGSWRHSRIPSMWFSMLSGLWLSGSISLTVSGVLCTRWAGTVRSGSTAGASSVWSIPPCSCWASSSWSSHSLSSAHPACAAVFSIESYF